MRSLLVVLSLAIVPVAAGCASEEDASSQGEDHLDALDVANSWTDAANPRTPDASGPIWWSWTMKLAGPHHELRAVLAHKPREPVAVFDRAGYAETGAFSLAPGRYGILIQFKETAPVANGVGRLADVTIAEHAGGPGNGVAALVASSRAGALTVSPASPIGAGGWRRAYLRFEVGAGSLERPEPATEIRRVHIENVSGVPWQLGLVAVHREGRPFWAMAHNPDSVARLDKALADGANALEPDLRNSSDNHDIALQQDGYVAVTEEGLTAGATASNGQATLTEYLRALKAKAPRKLVIWDTKPGAVDNYLWVGTSIQNSARREGYDLSKSVFNITNDKMTDVYRPFRSYPEIGRCFDGIFTQVHSHTAEEWMAPVRANKLTFQGLGVTPQLQTTEKWSVPISVYVRAREQEEYPKKIYFWTVNDADAIRRVLDLGVDAIISDEIPRLRSILQEEPYASMFRYATDDDDHNAKHGGVWFHVESSARLR